MRHAGAQTSPSPIAGKSQCCTHNTPTAHPSNTSDLPLIWRRIIWSIYSPNLEIEPSLLVVLESWRRPPSSPTRNRVGRENCPDVNTCTSSRLRRTEASTTFRAGGSIEQEIKRKSLGFVPRKHVSTRTWGLRAAAPRLAASRRFSRPRLDALHLSCQKRHMYAEH